MWGRGEFTAHLRVWNSITSVSFSEMKNRREHDLLGDRDVPATALYGVQTLRAMENFAISGVELSEFPTLVAAIAAVKEAAAETNRDLGLLSAPVAQAIIVACQ